MAELPRGTVTLLFTDIEGSTRLLQELGRDGYVQALEDHRRLLREALTHHGGVEVEMQGDSFHFAFAHARQAVLAAADAQRALAQHEWEGNPIEVRIGLHTGEPVVSGALYAGLDVHRAARVMSSGHGGQVLLSEATRALVDGTLEPGLALRDLGHHRLKDLSAPQRLHQLVIEGLRSQFPPLRALHETNLPVPPTAFVGRERELAEVTALLARPEVRLLTLTGPGGTGKTRLAAQAAGALAAQHADGVWWISLAALRDPELVLQTAEQELGAKSSLGEHIGARSMLLLLDNFEHVLAAAVDVAALLEACPNLDLLVTSREPLHVSGEQEYPVPPLARNEAAALFRARARAVEPGYDANGLVPEICRRLDDLPLALELAAGRVRALSPEQMLARLEQRLPLLTGGARDLPQRQRTLRATIEWSYELLTAEEQCLFTRLAVFTGGCTLEAAEAVVHADLDELQSLVEKNLLRHSNGRFWMLETIREYALERLAAGDEENELRRRHAEHFAKIAADAHTAWVGPGSVAAGDELGVELENLRAALLLAVEAPYPRLALRLAISTSTFWQDRGHAREGLSWIEAAEQVAGREDPGLCATALWAAGCLAGHLAEPERARTLFERAMTFARRADDRDQIARIIASLGSVDAQVGDFAAAREKQAVSIDFFRQSGDRERLAVALGNVAHFALFDGSPAEGIDPAREALAICRDVAYEALTAWMLLGLGSIELALGNDSEAEAAMDEALHSYVHCQDPEGIISCLERQATLVVGRGNHERAARLFGAAAAARREHDFPRQRNDESLIRPFLEELRSRAQPQVFARAWREGEAMSLDDAVAYALGR